MVVITITYGHSFRVICGKWGLFSCIGLYGTMYFLLFFFASSFGILMFYVRPRGFIIYFLGLLLRRVYFKFFLFVLFFEDFYNFFNLFLQLFFLFYFFFFLARVPHLLFRSGFWLYSLCVLLSTGSVRGQFL